MLRPSLPGRPVDAPAAVKRGAVALTSRSTSSDSRSLRSRASRRSSCLRFFTVTVLGTASIERSVRVAETVSSPSGWGDSAVGGFVEAGVWAKAGGKASGNANDRASATGVGRRCMVSKSL